MQLIGFFLGITIGITLSLIGSGGSILTIPILVYLLGISPSNATTYSLFVVGVSSFIGAINGAKDKLIDLKTALFFGTPSVVSIFIMRNYIVPLIPNTICSFFGFIVLKDFFIMLVFGILIIVASFSMIKKPMKNREDNHLSINYNKISINGIFIGLLTGFVGVGGGFLIIPTLLFAARLPMKKAVGTSLVIICANSLLGFAGSLENAKIDWILLLEFTSFAVVGVFTGLWINKRVNNEKLKSSFGWFLLVTGIYMICKETILK